MDRYVATFPVPQFAPSPNVPVPAPLRLSLASIVSLPSVRAVFRRMDEEGEERRAKQFPNSPPVTVYFTNVYP